MATATPTKKRLVLRYADYSFSFSRFDMTANNDKVYALAQALYGFQLGRPPKEIACVLTSRVS